MRLLFGQSDSGEAAKNLRSLSKDELRKIYSRIFSTKDGKIVLEDLANASGMYRTNFVQGSSDYTAFLEGHRALLLYICSQLEEHIDNIEGIEGKYDQVN
jgi:cytochrome c peroxidase